MSKVNLDILWWCRKNGRRSRKKCTKVQKETPRSFPCFLNNIKTRPNFNFLSQSHWDSLFLHLHTFFCHPHTKCKNTVFSFFVPPPYIIRKLFLDLEVFLRFIKSRTLFCIWNKPMDYIIRKLISYLERLPDYVIQKLITHLKKRLPDYIIRKLILCIEKTSRLCNPEANHKSLPDHIIRKLILDLEKDFQIM